MNIIARTNSNLIAPGTDLNFTAEDIAERESGSKWVLVVEQMQCAVIWSVKGCFLIMYNRLTFVSPLLQKSPWSNTYSSCLQHES